MNEPIAIAFFPEDGDHIPGPVRRWQARNPFWRELLPERIVCPVCSLPVRAVADLALLDDDALALAIRRFRDRHLRVACSDHNLPTPEDWAYEEGRRR